MSKSNSIFNDEFDLFPLISGSDIVSGNFHVTYQGKKMKFADYEKLLSEQVKIDIGYDYKVITLDGYYHVDLDRCNTPLKIISWMSHLFEKEWITREMLERFMHLACGYHEIDDRSNM